MVGENADDAIGRAVDKLLNPAGGLDIGFVLVMFPAEADGPTQLDITSNVGERRARYVLGQIAAAKECRPQ